MFPKLVLLVTLTLSLSVAASPTIGPHSPPKRSGEAIKIDLLPRSSLKKADGTFDHEGAIKSIRKTIAKYARNKIDERNVAGKVQGEGVQQDAAVTATDLHRRQTESLIENGRLGGIINIVTGGLDDRLLLLAGSADLWVSSTSCTSTTCIAKARYDPTKSSTSILQSNKLQADFVTGLSASGPVYQDTVTIAGVNVEGQVFSGVDMMSDGFSAFPYDGIMGLAPPGSSLIGANPFVSTAKEQGLVPDSIISMTLSASDPSLLIGDVNRSSITGDIEYHSVFVSVRDHSEPNSWLLANGSIRVNSEVAVELIQTFIDTGSAIIFGPSLLVEDFYAKIPGSKTFDPANGIWSYPCSSDPTISFDWDGGKQWTISPELFNTGLTSTGSSDCIGAVHGFDTTEWIVGDIFLQNKEVAFSYDNRSIGFAELATP